MKAERMKEIRAMSERLGTAVLSEAECVSLITPMCRAIRELIEYADSLKKRRSGTDNELAYWAIKRAAVGPPPMRIIMEPMPEPSHGRPVA